MDFRAVITGACGSAGRAFAEGLHRRGATLILSDHEGPELAAASRRLGATALFCDVGSSASVAIFAAAVSRQLPVIDLLVNAAGSGYERTLGMHRVSRALMPALRHGGPHKWILNVPPSTTAEHSDIFPYASSREAFLRLSEALAQEVRGTGISVGILSPAVGAIAQPASWGPHSERDVVSDSDVGPAIERAIDAILSETRLTSSA